MLPGLQGLNTAVSSSLSRSLDASLTAAFLLKLEWIKLGAAGCEGLVKLTFLMCYCMFFLRACRVTV